MVFRLHEHQSSYFIQNSVHFAKHAESRAQDPELEARIQAFELAFRMQAQAPQAFDVESESEATIPPPPLPTAPK